VHPNLADIGDRSDPIAIPYGAGLIGSDQVRVVPFNDAEYLERVLRENAGQVAGMIMEPAMMNCNIVKPVDGYLQRVRELCTEHGAILIFDEVKTGAAAAAGGATELFGVTPDVVCLAKAICGGLPGGAVGMTDALGELVASGAVRQQGTFNGNPLTMAAAETALLQILTPEGYAKLHGDNEALMAGCDAIIERYGLPAHTVGIGSKGCVIFSAEPVREYREYLTKVDHELTNLAWLYHMNHGVFMTPGEDEEWTLSVMHDQSAYDRYLEAFEDFAREVTGA
jgi:glutamate-1-semialdehyde 2,1-aminomutase